MTAKSLFNIVLKVLGLSFVKDIISSIPTLLGVFYSFGQRDVLGAFSSLLLSALTLLVYCVVAYYFIFRTDWVMQTFRLLENFAEDLLPLNIHRSTVVTISLLIVALYITCESIPLLVRSLIKWYQYNRMTRGMYNDLQPFDYSTVLAYAVQLIIGLLLIGYQRQVVNYIELKTRQQNK